MSTPSRSAVRSPAAVVFAFCVSALIYLLLLGEGSLTPWGGGLRSSAYDSLAQSIIAGRADVRPEAIEWEGYEIGGRYYMYFGPWPAILRIPLLMAGGADSYGQWGKLSCLAALSIAVWFGAATLGLSARTIFAMALGTPLFYLAASARIYNEAIAWGVAWELGALYAFFRSTDDPRKHGRWLGALSVFAALALLSRVTCGVGSYALLGAALWKLRRSLPWRILLAGIAPATFGVAAQLAYNLARFGDMLSFDHRSYIDVASLGGALNPARIPSTLYNYLVPRPELFSAEWPFVTLLPPHYFRPEVFFEWREEVLPLAIGSLWLVLAGLLGLFGRIERRHLACLALLPQAAIILCYYAVTERYAIEISLPLIALAAGQGSLSLFSIRIAAFFSSVLTVWFTVIWIALGIGETGLSPHHKGRTARMLIGSLSPSAPHFPVEEKDIVALKREPGTRVYVTNSELDDGGPTFHGEMLDRSIIMEANSMAALSAPPGATRFESVIGFVDMRPPCWQGSARALVLRDGGEIVYDSGEMRQNEMPSRVAVNVNEGEIVTLVVDGAGSRSMCDLVVWAYPSWVR